MTLNAFHFPPFNNCPEWIIVSITFLIVKLAIYTACKATYWDIDFIQKLSNGSFDGSQSQADNLPANTKLLIRCTTTFLWPNYSEWEKRDWSRQRATMKGDWRWGARPIKKNFFPSNHETASSYSSKITRRSRTRDEWTNALNQIRVNFRYWKIPYYCITKPAA